MLSYGGGVYETHHTTAVEHDGTNNAEVIDALGGNDEIDGLDGADTLYAGDGDDGQTDLTADGIAGGNGNDTSYGGAGDDFLTDYDYNRHNNCDLRARCQVARRHRSGGRGHCWLLFG